MAFECGMSTLEAEDNLGGAAKTVKCKSWLCEKCQPWRVSRLIAEIMSGDPNTFITLTASPNRFKTPYEMARVMSAMWAVVVKRWRRLRKSNKCEYFCVFEAHKSGWPHIHILWRGGWIDFFWLQAQWKALTGGHRVEVQALKTKAQAAYYTTKYCGKAPHKFGTCKRYWFTQGYRNKIKSDWKPVISSRFKWRRQDVSITQVRAEWQRKNRTVIDIQDGWLAWGRYWDQVRMQTDPDPPRLRYRNGFLHWHTSKGWGAPAVDR